MKKGKIRTDHLAVLSLKENLSNLSHFISILNIMWDPKA